MGTSANDSRDMVSIMENYASLNGETGMNPDVQVEDMEPLAMPPHLDAAAANYNAASDPSKTMGHNKFLLGKPKRPLSAYNIFFQHEREKIVSNAPDTPVTLESLKIDSKRKVKKRRHRKSHGKIGFADLARMIAAKWKTLDAESRAVFEACAAKEKERYQKEIKEWKAFKKTRVAAEEESAKKQAALNRASEMMYTSSSMMNDGISNRDLQDMRSLESAAWSSRTMTGGGTSNGHNLQSQPASMEGVQDPRDYLKITQQVIDMARASLSLPLFANLGETAIMDDSTRSLLGEQPSLRMNGNPSSNLFHSSNNMESAQLSNGALLNVPFGNNMASFDNDSLYQNQLMQSIDSNIQGYLNQTSQYRDELETRAFLSQPMQYHQAELDSSHHPDLGQAMQDHGYNGVMPQSRQGDADADLINMINASLKDRY